LAWKISPSSPFATNVRSKLRVRAKAVLHGAHEHAVGLLGGLRHRRGLVAAARERALAQHVLARFERRDRHRRVQEVRSAHVDRVDVVAIEQLLDAAVGVRDAELLGDARGLLAIAIDERRRAPALPPS
jgi:hypothetical protein